MFDLSDVMDIQTVRINTMREDCDNYDPEEEYERQRQRHHRYYEREEDEIIDEDAEDDEEDEFDDYDDYPPEDEFDARLDLTDEEREEYAEYRREMIMRDRQRRAKRSMHAMDGSVHLVLLNNLSFGQKVGQTAKGCPLDLLMATTTIRNFFLDTKILTKSYE